MTPDPIREAFETWYTELNPRESRQGITWDAWQAATLAERERCAKACEESWPSMHAHWGPGQARAACEECAAAIRKGPG